LIRTLFRRGPRNIAEDTGESLAPYNPCGDDFRRGALQAVIVDVGERKMAAAPCERGRDRPPDPRGSPCHDGRAAL